MRFLDRTPPGTAANFTRGMREERRGVPFVVGGGTISIGLGGRGDLRVIAGTLPGVLLRVKRTCDRGVVFRIRLLVGLGAAMIGGAFVMRCNIGTLCSGTLCSGTLCSGRVGGTGGGAICGSSEGRSHACSGCVTWEFVG